MTRAFVGLRTRLAFISSGDSRSGMDPTQQRWGYLVATVIATIGGFLRFSKLDRPHTIVFDETYYVKEAASFLRVGYELRTQTDKQVDVRFAAGQGNVFTNTADFVVHPPLGKWMIAVGELIFGTDSSWGWRFSSAVVGTLSIFMLVLIAKRLFGSVLLGGTAGLLLALDGEHFVHSRTGLLDVFVMFWALATFGCILIDRDLAARRLAARGPTAGIGIRWWRIAAGLCAGLCMGTKWSGLYFLAAFALLSVLWDIGRRRAAGARHWWVRGTFQDGGLAFVQMVPIAVVAYLTTWTGWFLSSDAWDRKWGTQHPGAGVAGLVPDALRGLWHYHQEMYRFHVGLTSPHTYMANPWSWMVMGRPTAFYYVGYDQGEHGCTTVLGCSSAITALGTPVLWWGATLSLLVLLFQWALRRDWRAGAILAGITAGWLPWFHFQQRTIFSFYAVAFTPFVVLALTYALGLLLGAGATATSRNRRLYGGLAAGAVVIACAACFMFFYPILSAELITRPAWGDRMWLPSWI